MRCSRRRALRLLGTSGAIAATAGCLSSGGLDDYALVASEIDLSSVESLARTVHLWPDPTAIRATTRVDFTDETKRRYVSELFDTGSVTVQQWPLAWRVPWGTETAPRPTFLRRDGTFYRVELADERRLRRERWHFAVERVEETPPETATVERTPLDLPGQDERVMEAALDAVYAGNDGFLGDPEFDELQTVEYHRELDADASELVPEPPFDFVQHEHSDEHFRPVVDRRTVSVPEWTYTVEEITDSPEAFTEHARDAIVSRELSAGELSASARGVVDDAVSDEDPRRYEEGAPPSEALSAVLGALGIAGDLRPIDDYDDRVDFKHVVAEYRGSAYRFGFVVTP